MIGKQDSKIKQLKNQLWVISNALVEKTSKINRE